MGPFIVRTYELLHKNEKTKIRTIFDDILIEVNPSKPGERGIPFYAFEPTVTREFLRVIKEGDVVFDVGSWIGYYTILAAKKVGFKGKVISVEPFDENIQRIKRNIMINNFSNVTILDVGVGDKPTKGWLLQGRSALMSKVTSEQRDLETVRTSAKRIEIESLDHIINKLAIQEVNMLILDVEGYEYLALLGLKENLHKHAIKNIICEIHPRMLIKNGVFEGCIATMLSQFGYTTRVLDKQDKNHPYHIIASLSPTNG